MRALIQRVKQAELFVDNQLVSSIDSGLLVLLGIADGDTKKEVSYIVKKITNLRIFEDDAGKMNLNLTQVLGQLLLVSQFTLHANTLHGNRPSFIKAMEYHHAQELFDEAVEAFKASIDVKTGVFGAHMEIHPVLDGPVTILIDTDETK